MKAKLAGYAAVAILVLGGFVYALLPGSSPQAQDSLELFCAPSHLPPGEQWVVLGAGEDLPEDLEVLSKDPNTAVLEVARLSHRALAVRVDVPPAGGGYLLETRSADQRANQEVPVLGGQSVPELAAAANFGEEDFVDGYLVAKRDIFMYGYLPATEGGISAVRIHNRQTGQWSRRELGLERAIEEREREEALSLPLPEGFKEVDVYETLPDTDGDGIYDFEEEPEVREPTPDFLGVKLVSGENILDLVVVDDYGNASWRTLNVYSLYTPPAQEQ